MAAADELMAGELGVHAGLVSSVRRDSLTEGEHWTREEGTGRIDYTAAGRDRLCAILQVEKIKGAAPADPGPAPATAPADPVRLKVVRLMPNPVWVGVGLPDGTVAEVPVRRRTGLRVGVLLTCQQLADGRWECVHQGHAFPLPKNERGAG